MKKIEFSLDQERILTCDWYNNVSMYETAKRLRIKRTTLYDRVHFLNLPSRGSTPYKRKKMNRAKPPPIPTVGEPLIIILFTLMNKEGLSIEQLSKKSGVGSQTIRSWGKNLTSPRLANVEACFNVLGYKLTIERS